MWLREFSVAYDRMSGSRWTRVVKVFRAHGLHAVIVYRFGNWLLEKPFYVRILLIPIKILLQHHLASSWGIEIGDEAKLGKGFRIVHYGGIFIDSRVVAGENLHISHDVTLGGVGSGKHKGWPTIGNNVYIAPGAKVVGNVRVGNNVKIGTNAVVDRDIPDNALVQVRPALAVVFPSYALTSETPESGPKEPPPATPSSQT